MKHNDMAERHHKLLRCFTHLPQQILTMSDIDNVAEYVLHSLCDEGCLGLTKAAYFIDNPDFDCLKGIAGFNKDEEIYTCDTVLGDEGNFKEHIDNCAFNKKVRSLSMKSMRRAGDFQAQQVRNLAGILGMTDPQHHSWELKHDNHGLLVFEREVRTEDVQPEEFIKALSILGFCPIN